MRGRRALSDEETLNLATYLRSLPPFVDSENVDAKEGSEVFQRLDCVSCHRPPLYTMPKAYDVGLEDERGEKLFNPPSLLGVRHRDGLFHDTSASSIEDLVLKRQHQIPPGVAERDLNALVAFLRSL